MNKKTIIRKAKNSENPYAQIAKSALQDNVLSWKATGLLSYILSLPDDWEVSVADLINRKTDGKASTRSGLGELITKGYVLRESHRNEKGTFIRHDYVVYEEPVRFFRKPTFIYETGHRPESVVGSHGLTGEQVGDTHTLAATGSVRSSYAEGG